MVGCVESLNVCDLRLVAPHDIYEPLIKCHGGREISVSVQLWLLSPLVGFDREHLACFWGVI
jgi:hypothetical protein